MLADSTVGNSQEVTQVLLVSGKLYYDLVKERATRHLESVAIVRVEELCPFPFAALKSILKQTISSPNVRIKWVQEEAQNQGAWPHSMPRLQSVLNDLGWEGKSVAFVGRPPSEVPAVGIGKLHASQLLDIMNRAFN